MSEQAGPQRPWIRHYPKSISWDMEIASRPLPEWFDEIVERHGGHDCTDFFGARMTYAELGWLAERAAVGLQALGVEKGTKVALMLPNTPTYIVFYFAILKAGGTVVNCNPLYTEEEITFQIKDSGARILVTLDLAAMFPKSEALLREGVLQHLIVCPFTDLLPAFRALMFALFKSKLVSDLSPHRRRTGFVMFDDLIDNSGTLNHYEIDPDEDVALLQYTGGTTGTPKGAMLTHANVSANLQQVTVWASEVSRGRQTILGILPFFHVFGMTSVMNFGLAEGSLLVLTPKFEIDRTLAIIDKLRPTVMPGVPTLFNAILHYPDLSDFDLSSLKFCISGGAALPLEVKKKFEALTSSQLVEGYGLSETSPVVVCNPINGVVKPCSIGVPMPRTEISIRSIDDPAQEMPTGEDGEICVKGPQVMKGYWNKPDETAQSFVDGYFRTGDIGHIDEDGFIFIVDRLKDMINASGFKIYPRRIEEAIYQHPAVEEATVVGIPDDYRGEAPKAFIKLREGATLTAEEIEEFLKKKISKIEMPSEFEFRDELPKTLIGKLSKKELRKEAGAG